MAKLTRLLISMATLAIAMELALATDYTVGAPHGGWDEFTALQTWAASKTFIVGDKIVFTYDPTHDVLQVSKEDYNSCNPDNAIAVYAGGLSTITFTTPGKMYFICGTIGHCSLGMKIEINVHTSAVPPPPPSHPSPPTTPLTPPHASAPTPSWTRAPWSAPEPTHAPWSAPEPTHAPWSAPEPTHAPWSAPEPTHAPWSAPEPTHAPWSAPEPVSSSVWSPSKSPHYAPKKAPSPAPIKPQAEPPTEEVSGPTEAPTTSPSPAELPQSAATIINVLKTCTMGSIFAIMMLLIN